MSEEMTNGGADNQDNATLAAGGDTQQTAPNLGAIRKAGQKEVIDVLAKVTGQQFGSTKDVATFVESLLQAKSTSGGSEQPTKSKADTSSKANGELLELRQMIQALNSRLEEKDTIVRKTSLQSQIKDVAVKAAAAGIIPVMNRCSKIEYQRLAK